jgi:3-hydroxymyristoyl/3-hydroxydecanoyl-(acyl carrier protein) dehydratase
VRYVLLDRITSLAPPKAEAVKCVSLSDDIFGDHFPGHPVMPGALILESLAQLGGVLVEASMRERGRNDLHAVLTMADKVKFRKLVRPGDRIELAATCTAASEDGGQVQGTAIVDGATVAEAALTFAFAKVTSESARRERKRYLDVWLTGSSEEP